MVWSRICHSLFWHVATVSIVFSRDSWPIESRSSLQFSTNSLRLKSSTTAIGIHNQSTIIYLQSRQHELEKKNLPSTRRWMHSERLIGYNNIIQPAIYLIEPSCVCISVCFISRIFDIKIESVISGAVNNNLLYLLWANYL